MKHALTLVATVALGSIAPGSAAPGSLGIAARTDDTYALRWTPKEGDAITYSTEGTLDINAAPAAFKSKVVLKVIKVDTDGTYSVQSNSLDGTVTYQGTEIAMQRPITVTLYKPDGEIISVSGQQTDPTSFRVANLTAFRRPDNPVKLGESWPFDVKADAKTGAVAAQGTFKLEDEETIGTYDTLKGSVSGTYWVNKADGSLVKYSGKWTNISFSGAPTPISGSITMTRLNG
jgi:hypothetical protein